ncbi:hypothetical protein FGU46_01210 [Methanobacterium sp. CWC-01]|uniref:hypothetical protein n=1 Tax=Methanobacterium aridiramus TaxID=2584467 RepID=UPI00257722B2|nr:hypothetical protein [Methanobacterium sp. CWC-01]WJI08806.1 hypothetical protein FGU46_01210 [Methanobacterium sp. CWC-01]
MNFWLWVEKEGGIDGEMIPGEEWCWEGCDYETEEGDLILVYRTRPYKKIQYLVKATSESRLEIRHLPDEIYKCNLVVLHDFGENSLSLDDMKQKDELKDWYPLKVSFVKMKFLVEEEYWRILQKFLTKNSAETSALFE